MLTRPHSSRPARLRRCLTVLGLSALCALPAACGGSSGSPAPTDTGRPGPSTMFTPSNVELGSDPTPVLDQLKHLGVDTVHLYLHWSEIAPNPTSFRRPRFDATNPADYAAAGWAPYDAVVRGAKAHGLHLLLDVISPPPDWASGRGAPDPPTQPQWRPSAQQFALFVRAVGKRYSGHYTPPGSSSPLPRVDFWSIWNEPNVGAIGLAPQATTHSSVELSGAIYRGLVDAGWSALHATGHGNDTILIGEVGPAGATFKLPGRPPPGQFGAMAPLRFLRALYCVDSSYRPLTGTAALERGCPTTAAGTKAFPAQHPGLFQASGFADHPYPQGLPPNEPTPHEPDYSELADLGNLEHALDALQRAYGSDKRYPIYSTEYGYQTTPPDPGAGTVSPAQAPLYLNWSEYITWQNPRLRSYDQYLLTDPANGVFATGLRAASGAEKPAYAAFRMPLYLPKTSGTKGRALEVWGCVRPAHVAALSSHRTQRVQIQFAPSGGPFKTVQTVPITGRYGYFDVQQKFTGSGQVRLAWAYPHGPKVFSRTVTISLQ